MGSYRVDTSRWPLVVHSVDGVLSDAQLDDYVNEATAVLFRGELHGVIIDLTRMEAFSAYARRRNSEWQKEYGGQLRTWCVGTGYVIPSPTLRFVAATVLLVGRLPTPYRICETRDRAEGWVVEQLLGAGLKLT
jgi:hypothetical protein